MKFTKIHLDVSELLFMMKASKNFGEFLVPVKDWNLCFLASFQFIIITVIAARLLTCFSSAGKNIDINFFITLC